LAKFEEAEKRMFSNAWVCMRCHANNKSGAGKPTTCRKCGSKKMRLKHKHRKAGKKA